MDSTPALLDLSFVAVVFGLYLALIVSLNHYKVRAQTVLILGGSIALWLGATGSLAATKILQDFSGFPPRFVLVIGPVMLASLVFGLSSVGQGLLKKLPLQRVVYLQSFRVAVEILLLLMAHYGVLPRSMTLEGGNYDMAVGLTAPLMGKFCFHGKRPDHKILLLWNIAGILILSNVVVHGVLSLPTQFQRFRTIPNTAILGSFPYIWLPCFLVPMAYFLHFIAIRASVKAMRG